MAGDPPAPSHLWGLRTFERALEAARSDGVAMSIREVAAFQRGFLAAWDEMVRAVEDDRPWPPADW